ncbi:MAG: hypothetical protein ACRD12_13155 [Acidimicrobiales bacterium]
MTAPALEPEAGPEQPSTQWFLGTVCLLLVALIVIDRARVLGAFGLRYTDEDQTIMWVTAQDLNHLRVFVPYFYGQSYASWVEALAAVPLLAAGVAVRTAVPVAAAVVGAVPCLLMAAMAWRRRAPLTAAVVLTGFLLLTTDAVVISSIPRGLTGGIFVAAIGVALVVGRREVPPLWAVTTFAALAVIGASLNQSSMFLSAPAGAYLVVRHWRRLEVWLWAGVGAGVGVILHTLAKDFYADRPAYDFHPEWQLSLQADVLDRSVHHLGDYFTAYAVDFLRTPVLPLVALAAAIALLVAKRGVPGAVAGVVAVGGLVVSLSMFKATDGTTGIFLPYFRFYLALPAVLAWFVVQAVSDERVRPWVNRLVAGGLLVLALAGFGWRQARLDAEVAGMTAGRIASGPGVGTTSGSGARTAAVLERCRETGELADRLDVELVVYAQDRLASYMCGAELYDSIETVYPPYERRTWRLIDESTNDRTAMLVADVDPGLCDRAAGLVSSCEVVSKALGMVVLRFPPQPVMDLVRRLGIQVRPFDLPVDPARSRSS